ncbi:MAG: DsbE family thiol:disulfide interchange protein [Gammaproteobacteria bacterium]
MRYFLPLVVLLAVGALFWVGLGLQPAVVPSPLIGQPVPEFKLPLLDDAERSFTHRELTGRVTLVHVWATWCVTCRAEHPTLLAFARSGRVPVIGFNYKDDRALALRWLEAAGDPYALNVFDESGAVAIDWGVYGTPETFVVDREGVIRYKHVGPLTDDIIAGELVPLLDALGAGQ